MLLMFANMFSGAAAGVEETTSSFATNGRKVEVERFVATSVKKTPAVIILHGAEGLSFTALGYRFMAQMLAQHGYAAYIVHYFDACATCPQPFMGADRRGREIEKNFVPWMTAISAAVDYVRDDRNGSNTSVGLIGFSLGAYLSLSVAAQNPHIDAVVDFFGGMPEEFTQRLKSMPPVLILHGERDGIVSVDEARRLEKVLKAKKQEYQIKIYANEGHGFRGPALQDSARRTLEFLERHLKSDGERGSMPAA